MEIMFQTTGKCNLNCWFCAYDFLPKKRKNQLIKMNMPLDKFKFFVDQCVDFGFDEFQLTPIIGEPLLDSTLLEKIKYLHKFKEVKRVSFFTNFIDLDEAKLKWLLLFPKLTMTISVYGLDRNSYKQTTKRDKFKKFEENIKLLAKHYTPASPSLEFFIRCPWHGHLSDLKRMINVLSYAKVPNTDWFRCNHITHLDWNGNWCGLVPDNTFPNQRKDDKKEGVCWFALIDNSIDPTGDIGLCGACDVKKETVIGNLRLSTFEYIYKEGEVFYEIINGQMKNEYTGCCKNCSEHHELPYQTIKEYQRKIPWLDRLL